MHDASNSINFSYVSNFKPVNNKIIINNKEDISKLHSEYSGEKFGNIEYTKCLSKALEKAIEENDLVTYFFNI